jgi:phosphomannomutase/phosphoglucomutase
MKSYYIFGESFMNPSVFREYDIRGIADIDLSDEFAKKLGFAYAQFISNKTPVANRKHLTVSVGEDCRISSPRLSKALVEGLRSGGIDVIRLGNCPTPVTYFSLFHLNLDGAIMITASHLSADHNGFKVCLGRDTINGEQIQMLRKIMEKKHTENFRIGSLSDYEIIPHYVEYLMKDTKLMASKKIVIDCGNGNGSQVMPQLFKKLNAKVIELFCEMDGHFPNHIPNPSDSANLIDLIDSVKKNQADFGIGIDGDADRIGIVDENGKIIFGDELLIIFAREILKINPGATIVSEVKSSFRLYDDIAEHGGIGIMWKTGHSLIEAKMKETKAALGGEMSGHMFFADKYLGYDDAIYAALRIYEIATQIKGPFSSLLVDLKSSFSTPEIRIKCSDTDKFLIVQKIIKKFSQNSEIAKNKMTLIDGIRIDFGDGWGLIRASNTEPVLSLRFEATSQLRLDEIKKIFEDALKEVFPTHQVSIDLFPNTEIKKLERFQIKSLSYTDMT